MEIEESALKRLDCKSTQNLAYGVCMLKSYINMQKTS